MSYIKSIITNSNTSHVIENMPQRYIVGLTISKHTVYIEKIRPR